MGLGVWLIKRSFNNGESEEDVELEDEIEEAAEVIIGD